jgi:hypothetical protein
MIKTILSALALAAVGALADDDTEKLAGDFARFSAKLLETVKGIKDEKTARAALPALDDLASTHAKLTKAVRELSGEKFAQVTRKSHDTLRAVDREFLRMDALPAAVRGVLKGNALVKSRWEATEALAVIRAKDIANQCEIYYLKHGQYPEGIEALTKDQPDGSKPLLPTDSILDPWGKKFQLSIEKDSNGIERVIVTTSSPNGKKLSSLPPSKK